MCSNLSSAVAEAVLFIRQHEPSDGYVLGFSGGKDSIVTYSLAKLAGVNFTPYLSLVPGNDNPDVLRFVRLNYPDVIFTIAHERTGFIKQVAINGLPSFRIRWCCRMFKEESQYSQNRILLTGVRAEESYKRSLQGRISSYNNTTSLKPVFYWTEDMIWDYIDRMCLPYPSLYDNGFARVGCVVCPFALNGSRPSLERMLRSMRTYPFVWKAVKKAAYKFFSKKQRPYRSFGHYWNAFLVGFHFDRISCLEDVCVPI